eukprot:TRINITY_DN2624_c0_g1_i1.p1 TRINITY_DN2624_c0_g1~~TRINITY_DN2624_c0_g1_i1.p1  ORF type:complete len:963 (-),score=198.57 TRINITY_DN2624_c0_g1_i1:165-2999(-)
MSWSGDGGYAGGKWEGGGGGWEGNGGWGSGSNATSGDGGWKSGGNGSHQYGNQAQASGWGQQTPQAPPPPSSNYGGATGTRVMPPPPSRAHGAGNQAAWGGSSSNGTLVCSGCQNPTVAKLISGNYKPHGSNHDQPIYKKETADDVSVLIYYWDQRDGPTFSGWWFGPKVGGDQVWAYNPEKGSGGPPSAGWRVPWDGQVDHSLKLGAGAAQSYSQPPSHAQSYAQPSHAQSYAQPSHAQMQRQQEDDRWKRQAEQKRRDEEAAKRRKQEQEEEARRAEERRKREKEEETRRREQNAAVAVRKVIQKVRIATPETYDTVVAELEAAQSANLENMGSLTEKVSQEAEKALQQAQQRIEDIQKKRAEDEIRAQEEERKRKEQEELVDKLMKEVREEVAAAEAKIEQAQEAAKSGEAPPDATPEAILEASAKIEKVLNDTQEAADATSKSIAQKQEEMGDNDASRKVKNEVWDLQDKIKHGKRALSKLVHSLQATREKATRKAAALKHLEKRKLEFDQHDSDKDGQLCSKEVLAFGQAVYDFVVPDDVLAKIMRVLEPINADKYQRMRAMVAIARSEARARLARAEEEERKKAREARRSAMQAAIQDAASALSEVESAIGKAEDDAKHVKNDAPAKELIATADAVDDQLKEASAKRTEASSKLEEAESEQYKEFEPRELPRLRQRYEKLQGRIEKTESLVKSVREKAASKASAELEKKRSDVVVAIRSMMTKDSKTGEQVFADINGGEAVSNDKFVAFVSGLSEDKLMSDSESAELFEHIATEGKVDKEAFLELIQVYYKCVKQTVLTESIAIKSKTVRRLEVGEVFKGLEGPTTEDGGNIERVRVQAIKDQAEGWATVAGNQGTAFLEPGGNLYIVVKETMLTEEFSAESKVIRNVVKGEILEVVEFPKKDESMGMTRFRAKARRDRASGWVTLTGNQGTSFLEPC